MSRKFHAGYAYLFIILAFVLLGWQMAVGVSRPLEFHLRFDDSTRDSPFSGRVYVLLTKRESKELPAGVNWFHPQPFFALDVKDWKPGETLVIDSKALGFPHKLEELPDYTYSIHAVMDLDRGERHFSTADGNLFSAPLNRALAGKSSGPVPLVLDQVYKAKTFPESDRLKLVDIESKLLSAFHERPMRLRAGVVLPKNFENEPERRYPVLYAIPAFGGTHFDAVAEEARNPTDVAGVEMIYVILDPSCRLGHHAFADSDNNGPCGQALVTELIPHIEKEFRALAQPTARFLTGHSSGGWSSLWLQMTYPDFFGGVWSLAPDPVDFRDFQAIDIYSEGENMFTDEDGRLRPLARNKDEEPVRFKTASDMEVVTGHGGQLGSFEAVFGPRGPGGKPRQLWDRATGKIDPETAKHWKRYDIRLNLEQNWVTLGPKLAGKIHVFMGSEDTYYLEGAALLLKESLAKLDRFAVVEILPGRDHDIIDRELRERIRGEMARTFERSHPE